MKRKGGIFVSMIMLLVVYLFACAVVLVFFYFFKYHITTTVLDEYKWNKVQEVPLGLFSMDIDGESFTSKMNKVYYGLEPEDEFVKKMHEDVINQQLFYQFPSDKRPFGYVVSVGDITISEMKVDPNCRCVRSDATHCYCSDECPKAGEPCGREVPWWIFTKVECDPSLCSHTKIELSEKFPFPLTFDGTDRFTDLMLYKVVGYI